MTTPNEFMQFVQKKKIWSLAKRILLGIPRHTDNDG